MIGWLVVIYYLSNYMLSRDSWDFFDVAEQAKKGVTEYVVEVFVNSGHFSDVDRHGFTNLWEFLLDPVNVVSIIGLLVAKSHLVVLQSSKNFGLAAALY